jgi:hypothetical protein
MSTSNQLVEALASLSAIPTPVQNIWVNAQCLKIKADEAKASIMQNLIGNAGDGNPLNLSRANANLGWTVNADSTKDFLVAAALYNIVAATDESVHAESVVGPLVAKVRQLESQLAEENAAANLIENDRQAKLEAARAAAIAAVELQFAQPEPPAPAEHEKPFRGKVKIGE